MKIIFENEKEKELFMDQIRPSDIMEDPIELCKYVYSKRYAPNGEDKCLECYESCGIKVEVSPK